MTLYELNHLPPAQLISQLTNCCGSPAWVNRMLPFFPVRNLDDLLKHAEEQWWKCSHADWKEAFAHHPEIGDIDSLKKKFAATTQWASGEQAAVNNAAQQTLEALADGNKKYREKFGYIFIVCATGKSADEMLAMLHTRLLNDPRTEIEIAAGEHARITSLRLQKLVDAI